MLAIQTLASAMWGLIPLMTSAATDGVARPRTRTACSGWGRGLAGSGEGEYRMEHVVQALDGDILCKPVKTRI